MQHQPYSSIYGSKISEQSGHGRQIQHSGNLPNTISSNYIHHPQQGNIYPHHQVVYPSNLYQEQRRPISRISLLRDIGKAGERDKDYGVLPSTPLAAYGGKAAPGYISNTKNYGFSTTGQVHDRNTVLYNNKFNPNRFSQMPTSNIKMDARNLPPQSNQTSPQLSGLHLVHGGIKKEQPIILHQDVSGKYPTSHSYHHYHHPITDTSVISAQSGSLAPIPDSVVSATYKIEDAPEEQLSGSNDSKMKEDLLSNMLKVDNKISEVQKEIRALEEKKQQLEERKNQAEESPEKHLKEVEEDASRRIIEPKHRDLWQVIYAENRKKSEKLTSQLEKLGQQFIIPLYNQPADTQEYHDNIKSFEEFRPRLLKFFKKKKKLQKIREGYLNARYQQLNEKWQEKVEQAENNPKQKAKDAKARELFEKVFPDIRKQRVQQERTDRAGTRGDSCRSDADFADIVDGLSEQESQFQSMRQLTVVPPRLLDREERKVEFINNNGLIRDPIKVYKEAIKLDGWTEKEKKVFMEKFCQQPKNFNYIASFIEKKSVSDCILYYYLTKKTNNYKSMVRKHSLKPRKPKPGRNQVPVTTHQLEQAPNKDFSVKSDKLDVEKERKNEVEERRTDRPPSPRMTRARMQTLNWKEDEISIVKDGFAKHGKDFLAVSRMLTDKSEQQVRNFYNNYKKKHGFEQLVENNKKKKGSESRRQTRRGQSPDQPPQSCASSASTSVNQASSSAADNAATVTSASAEKGSVKKDKNDDVNKKAAGDGPSSTSRVADGGDVKVTSTSQMRTRRKTAAIAAAAVSTLAAQDAETTSGSYKRSSSSRPASGEPTDKKSKKNEAKKSKHLKISVLPAASTAEKDQAQSPDEKKPSKGDKKHSEAATTEKREDSTAKRTTSKVKTEAVLTDDIKSQIGGSKSLNVQGQGKTTNSSACSADAKTTSSRSDIEKQRPPSNAEGVSKSDEKSSVTTTQRNTTDSPYAFDDDANDVTTVIRLEPLRDLHPSATSKPATPTTVTSTPTSLQTPTTKSSTLTTVKSSSPKVLPVAQSPIKQPKSEASDASVSKPPQTLPPSPASSPMPATSTSLTTSSFRTSSATTSVLITTGVSRPSSTTTTTANDSLVSKSSSGEHLKPQQQQQRPFVVFSSISSTVKQKPPPPLVVSKGLSAPSPAASVSSEKSDAQNLVKSRTTPVPTAIPVNALRFTTTKESPMPVLQKSSVVSNVKPTTHQMAVSKASTSGTYVTPAVPVNLQSIHQSPSTFPRHSPKPHQPTSTAPPPLIEISPMYSQLDPATAASVLFHRSGTLQAPPLTPQQLQRASPVLQQTERFRTPEPQTHTPPTHHRNSPQLVQQQQRYTPSPSSGVSVKAEKPEPSVFRPAVSRQPSPALAGVNLKTEKLQGHQYPVGAGAISPTPAVGMNLSRNESGSFGYAHLGSIVSGTPIRRKGSDDASSPPPSSRQSHQPLPQQQHQSSPQRTSPHTPPSQQSKFSGAKRKDHHHRVNSPLSYTPGADLHHAAIHSRHTPPPPPSSISVSSLCPPGLDRALKEENKRPSSVSSEKRHSSDRSSPMPNMRGSKYHEAQLQGGSGEPPPVSVGIPAPLILSSGLRMGAPTHFPISKLDHARMQVVREYRGLPLSQGGFPRPIRPFSIPNMSDALDSSRHNAVLTQDYATALHMQRQALADAQYRGATILNPIIPLRPPIPGGSPTPMSSSIMDRIGFIQQPIISTSARASSSPSTSLPSSIIVSTTTASSAPRPRFPAPNPSSYLPRTSSADRHSPAASVILPPSSSSASHRPGSTDAAINAHLLAAVKQQQQQHSTVYFQPPPSHLTPPGATVASDAESVRAVMNAERMSTSPIVSYSYALTPPVPAHLQQHHQRKDVAMGRLAASKPAPTALNTQCPTSREVTVGSSQDIDQNQLMNASAAKDLKAKGKTTFTPQGFISAIIDHNIRRYGESLEEKSQKAPISIDELAQLSSYSVDQSKSRPKQAPAQQQALSSSSRDKSSPPQQQQQQQVIKSTFHQPYLTTSPDPHRQQQQHASAPPSARGSPAPASLASMQDKTNSFIASMYKSPFPSAGLPQPSQYDKHAHVAPIMAAGDLRPQHRGALHTGYPSHPSDPSQDHHHKTAPRMRINQGLNKFPQPTGPAQTDLPVPPHHLMNSGALPPLQAGSSSLDLIIRSALLSEQGLAGAGIPHLLDDAYIKRHRPLVGQNSPGMSAEQQTDLNNFMQYASGKGSHSSGTSSPSSLRIKRGSNDASSHHGSNPNISSGFDSMKTSSAPSNAPYQLFSALRFRTGEPTNVGSPQGGVSTSRSSSSASLTQQQQQQVGGGNVGRKIGVGGGSSSPAPAPYRAAVPPPPPRHTTTNELNYEPISDDED